MRVCILDSGVDPTHPLVGELESAVVISIGEDDEVVADEDTEGDVSGHGTACAGIIRSLAPECTLAERSRARCWDDRQRAWFWSAGLRWAVDEGYDVINLSLGWTKKREVAGNVLRAHRQRLLPATRAGDRLGSQPRLSTAIRGAIRR